ncbi:MAG: hypothetical protein KAS95_06635 [Candidatus Heimdallarchaeota archaeon]|nr:hypothetical protein [Candidatus Heimdallarchaeota archaeon]
MALRVFKVRKDGTYNEIEATREALQKEHGSFLMVDRRNKKIYIYKKLGISKSLAYAAARAATNLNTRKGSKYKVVNIEQEEQFKFLSNIFGEIEETVKPIEEKYPPEAVKDTKSSLIYGEKTSSTRAVTKQKTPKISEKTRIPQEQIIIAKKRTVPSIKIAINEEAYDSEEIVKTLASRMLYDINIDTAKNMIKPPKDQLRAMLLKQIDALLDEIY